MNLSNDLSTVQISAVDLNGDFFQGTVSVIGNSRVSLLGNAVDGYLVKLRGPSSDHPLERIATPAAVDAVFAGL